MTIVTPLYAYFDEDHLDTHRLAWRLFHACSPHADWVDVLSGNLALVGLLSYAAGVAVNLHAGAIHRDHLNAHIFGDKFK